MLGSAILCLSLGAIGAGDFLRPFGAKAFDQASFDAETFGDKKSISREDDGLKVTVAPGLPEAGWKTPPTLRIGGDFSISATILIRKLPKPGQEDGSAVGLAIGTQDVDQPEATLLRQVEMDGKDVYRPFEKAEGQGSGQPIMMVRGRRAFNPFGNGEPEKATKPVRRIFPARGTTIRLEMVRQGPTLRYQVFDDVATLPREVGQFAIGPVDVAGVKLFASNRNGTDPVDVTFRDLTIHADRISGLGTSIRTIFGNVVQGEPTAIENGRLVIGGPPPAPAPGDAPKPKPAPAPAAVPAPGPAMAPAAAVPAAPAAPAAAPTTVVTNNFTITSTPITIDQVPKPVEVKPAPAPGPATPPAAPATPPKPKALIPLDEVEVVAFERSALLSGRYLGQPNIDVTSPGGTPAAKDAKDAKDEKKDVKKPTPGDDLAAPPPGTAAVVKLPKVEPKPNGIRDLHLTLASLREVGLQQIMIQCQTDKGQSIWQLDTSGSTNSPINLRRAGVESWADLFLEPPAGDCFEKEFMITLTYADGQPANTKIKATEHTDAKLAFDPEAPTPPLDARFFLAGDEQLFGKLESITEETLSLITPWGDRLAVPMTRVLGVYLGMPDHKETPEAFAKRLKAPGSEDTLLARAKDGEVVAITGVVEGSKANKLTFAYQGKARTLPLKVVEGLILAARPGPKPPTEVRPTFSMAGGIVVSGKWAKIEAAHWEVETPWGPTIKLPANDVRNVRFRGGQMSFLSDLVPSQVEEVPYFSRRAPYRKDLSLTGQPLRLDGQAIEKGLAVHSRTVLTYDLNKKFASFETLVGFDDSAKKKGRVDCRVIADGKELYANPDLRADAPPVKLSLSVAGADQLKLVIDFGPDEDTGDRVIWANARLYQRTSTAAPNP